VPEPSADELRKLESYQPCTMCGAHGELPETEEQAAERGARWYDWMAPAVRSIHCGDDRSCNVCHGSGQERVGMEGWYTWRCQAWGCKWDAAFADTGPMFGIGDEGMDVTLSKETQVATVTPTVAVFKFDTPWSPPVPVVEAASEQHPELEFVIRYAELGNGYGGEVKFVSGLRLVDEELEVEEVLSPEEMWF
jgi:hypothetical protein